MKLPPCLVLAVLLTACGADVVPQTVASSPKAPAPEACTLIQNVRVFDGEKVISSSSVVLRDKHIAEVGNIVTCTKVVDGKNRTLLPGLIDAHVHVWDASHLETAMRFGVTTALDMMGDPRAGARLKVEAARHSDLADLRIAGNPVTSRGGHGTEYGRPIPTLDRPEDADAFVAERLKEGSDYLKIVYTPDTTFFRSISRETLRASVEAAHRRHLLTVVHVDTLRGASEALEAGADGLAHLFYDVAATRAVVALAKARGAFVVPTLSVLKSVAGKAPGVELAKDEALAPKLGERALRSLKAKFPITPRTDEGAVVASMQAFQAAGVALLAGTDAPNPGTFHGVSMHGELELLVAAGLSPPQALAAATSAPARAFALADRGRIAPGLRANLLLVDGDPTRDIRATRHIAAVWKEGIELGKPQPAAEESPQLEGDAPEATASEVPRRSTGLISDFEGDVSSRFGVGWKETTDSIMGGTSTATVVRVRSSGRRGWNLAVNGDVAAGLPYAWSGVMFNPGDSLFSPADLSAGKELVFSSRGDGKTYSVLLFTQKKGRTPLRQSFVTGKEWKKHRIPLAGFEGTDGSDVVGIAFVAGPKSGKYALELDDIELR